MNKPEVLNSGLHREISPKRRIVNASMLTLTGIFTLFSISALFFILGYLLYNGISSLSWDFFTKLPKPTGEVGGGMANAIVGSGKILLLATIIGVPVGFMAGVYLAEYAGRTFAFIVRYVTDLLNGVPSIVIGIFAYAMVVRPMKHFSTLAGGIALGIMMIPIAVRTTEAFLRAVPVSLREGAMALGANNDVEPGASRRRDCAVAVHGTRQHVLEFGMVATELVVAGYDLSICDFALRGLSSPSVGSGLRTASARAFN
jgi:ABC-type phosphate transport system permease subunit